VANGPSLNRTDFSEIRREIVFGLNKIFLGLRRFRFYPRYYVAVNPYVIEQSVGPIKALNCVKFLCGNAAKDRLNEDALTHHLSTDRPMGTFSKDLVRGLNQGYTVTFAALQIAYFLGFAKVVLVGLDHRYAFEGKPNDLQRMQGVDPNHFDEAYFAQGQSWQNPDLLESEASYRLARQAFAEDGRTIVDATIDGCCSVFQKASLAEALA
jgi:hypothetical protein